MDEDVAESPSGFMPEDRSDSLYPVFFGISCAFFALNLISDPETQEWLEERNKVIKGSAHLMGMFLWKVHSKRVENLNIDLLNKLEDAEKHVAELKRRRNEEAKANERVMSIVAAREQSWFNERKMLRQQIGSLTNELRVAEAKNEKSVCELRERLVQSENLVSEKDRLIDAVEEKRREIEERVRAAEVAVAQLTEKAKLEAEYHSSEILRYKTATIELVSAQRQLEAELNRALRRLEASNEEADSATEQKEQALAMNQRLSTQLVKLRKDLEQKDQVLSVLLRKLDLGNCDKQMAKATRKHEAGAWKGVPEFKNDGHLLKNLLSKHVKGYHHQPELRGGLEIVSVVSNRNPIELTGDEEEQDQRHNLVIEAFVEQLRLKDERLEALQWRLLSSDIEAKRMQSYVHALERDFMQLKQENVKLEELVLDRENELHSLKEQILSFEPLNLRRLEFNPSPDEETGNRGNLQSNIKIIERRLNEGNQEARNNDIEKNSLHDQVKDIVLDVQNVGSSGAPVVSLNHSRTTSADSNDFTGAITSALLGLGTKRELSNSTRKMDIHALGITHKIKRLKQQLLVLERLKGKQECDGHKDEDFEILISLLYKQADRYQSLQGKIDDLSQRMQDNNLNLSSECSSNARTPEEAKILEHFLEETFQLQRYIVATGQKLAQVQTKIASGLQGEQGKIENLESFDAKRFADTMRTLFREVQMGLEIRISRIIGNLEGTLACNGIIHLKR